MTDLEISKALALAIGWKLEQMLEEIYSFNGASTGNLKLNCGRSGWNAFSYRDWNVIGPIAEKFDCFPIRFDATRWEVYHDSVIHADTPQRAIALAVIGAKK